MNKLAFAALATFLLSACTFNEHQDREKLPEHPETAIGLDADASLEAYDFGFGQMILYLPAGYKRTGTGVRQELEADNVTETFFNSDSSVFIEVALKGKMTANISKEGLEGAQIGFQNIAKKELNGTITTNEFKQIADREFLVVQADIDWMDYHMAVDYYATLHNDKLFTMSIKYPLADVEATEAIRAEMIRKVIYETGVACDHPLKFYGSLIMPEQGRTVVDSVWTPDDQTGAMNLAVLEINGCSGNASERLYRVENKDVSTAWLYKTGEYGEAMSLTADTIFEPGTIEIDSIRFFRVPVMTGEWKVYDQDGNVELFWSPES